MKKNLSLVVLLAAFVLVLGGAFLLYSRLGSQYAPDTLASEEPSPSPTPSADSSDAGEVPDSDATPEESEDDEENDDPQLTTAPDFTVVDLEGNEVHLSDFIGKPIILNFWASWCGPCKKEMPDFDELYAEYGEDIHFVMVNMTDGSRETLEGASEFIEDQGYSFPVYYDTEYDAAITYGVTALPTTYFIDAEGYLVAHALSALDRETILTGIDMILPAA